MTGESFTKHKTQEEHNCINQISAFNIIFSSDTILLKYFLSSLMRTFKKDSDASTHYLKQRITNTFNA